MKILSASLIFSFAISCISIFAISLFSQFSYTRLLNQASEDGLAEFASFIAVDIARSDSLEEAIKSLSRNHADYSRLEIQRDIYDVRKKNPENRIYMTDSDGILLFNNGSAEALGENRSRWIDIAAAKNGNYGARTTLEDGSFTLYSSVPVIKAGKVIAIVSVAHSNKDMLAYIITAGNRLLVAMIIVLGISLILALMFSHYISSPIRKLNSYIRKLTSGQKDPKVPGTSIHEIKQLTDSFDRLHRELSGKQYVEKALQAISHEIRSPVTVIKAASELISENAEDNKRLVKSIAEQSERIEILINNLLDLSRIKNLEGRICKEKIEFSEFWKELQADCSRLAARLVFENDVRASCKIDSFMLRRAVLILIENSQKFSGRHDEIKIHAESSGSEIIITVKDQGAGIPEWAELKIFDEFFSLPEPDSNQKGSGIGLSLAKHIAICHSGNLEVFNSRKIDLSEKGVTARLSVPFVCDGGN